MCALICQALGKRVFKRHLQPFIEPMFDTARGSHQLSACAAADCIGFVNAFIGPSIFRGRLEPDQLFLLESRPHIANAVTAALVRAGRTPGPPALAPTPPSALGPRVPHGRAAPPRCNGQVLAQVRVLAPELLWQPVQRCPP